MKLDSEVKRSILLMAVGCAVCSAVVVILFSVFGYFDYTVLVGALIGYILAVGNFFFMSIGIIRALETGDETVAKIKMRSSYIGRTVVMLAVMAVSIAVPFIHWLPVILSIFYPRIVISAKNIISMFAAKKEDPKSSEIVSENTDAVDTDSNETDEFEKFVSGFAKGPVPDANGSGNSNKTENKEDKQ